MKFALSLFFGIIICLSSSSSSSSFAASVSEERLQKARSYPYLGKQKSVAVWTPSDELGFFDHDLQYEEQFHENLWIAWSASEANDTITITLALNGLGWIGFGPTVTGSMIGVNPCIVREVPVGSGNYTAIATHADDFVTPTENTVQNCELLEYRTSGSESLATFRRPMTGCFPEDVDYTARWDMRFAAAWGNDQNYYYHGVANRATREFNIIDGIYQPLPLPDDVIIFDALMLPMFLPAYRDVYFCRGFVFPQDRRYHVVRLDPLLVSDISPASYHHLLVFSCPNGLPDEYLDPNYTAKCPVIPSLSCSSYFGGWALGGGNQYFDKFGMPIGDGVGAPKTFLLQTHVDNPNSDDTIFDDGWGIRFYYTPTLREVEGGTFGLYSGTPLVGIPPLQEHFEVLSECSDAVTRSAFPNGMYIESVFVHMHYAGRTSRLEVIRHDDETDNWYQLRNPWEMGFYDSNWQGSRRMAEPGYRIEAGDRLRLSCSWNTMHKTEPTRNGEGFDDEMCIDYIIYYPVVQLRDPITICAEFPPGIGITFTDVPPFLNVIGQYEYDPYEEEPNICSNETMVPTIQMN